MKKVLKEWRRFLSEEKKSINTKEELIDLIKKDPDQKIYLDNPKGTTKKFGGVDPITLPFDYGEYPEIINPADGMGWDIIIVPGSTEENKDLTKMVKDGKTLTGKKVDEVDVEPKVEKKK